MARLAADSVVDRLRTSVLDGRRRPGDRLDETRLGKELDVSRNTLREAFRVLAHEHLVEHRPHHGVFVRHLSAVEARDVYRTRRLLECGALREAAQSRAESAHLTPTQRAGLDRVWEHTLLELQTGVDAGRAAREAGDWEAVGTANGRFHLSLASLAGNDVINRTLRSLLTEMRLLFVVVGSAREVHEPYVDDNARICALVTSGELVRAAIVLEEYLLRAERHLVGLYQEHDGSLSTIDRTDV